MSDLDDAFVGDRIREGRHAANMTQTALGKRLGVTYQQIQKYESGKSRIGPGALVALSKALGKPIGFFLPGVGPSHSAPIAVSKLLASKEGFELAQKFQHISAQARRVVLDLVSVLAKETA